MNKFEIKDIANENKGLFVNGLFAGIFSEYHGITQFSGNKNQVFDVDVCIEYLKSIKPNAAVYSSIINVNNQRYLQVSFKPMILGGTKQEIH
jgi:hypothetical protein